MRKSLLGLAFVWATAAAILGVSNTLHAQTPLPAVQAPVEAAGEENRADAKATEAIVAAYLKKEADKKKAADEAKKKEEQAKKDYELYDGTRFDLQSLYDSLSVPAEGEKKWYEKLSIRGYTQVRFGRTLNTDDGTPNLFGDRTINGNSENKDTTCTDRMSCPCLTRIKGTKNFIVIG